MEEAIALFDHALTEKNIDANISYEHDRYKREHTFTISKELHHRSVAESVSVTDEFLESHEHITKWFATEAERVSLNIRDEIESTIRHKGRDITICTYDNPRSSCDVCGRRFELEPSDKFYKIGAELSNPAPLGNTSRSLLENINEEDHSLLQLYLVGGADDVCTCTTARLK